MTDERTSSDKQQPRAYWLLYLAALVAGAILLADAFAYAPAQKVTARLGIGLLFSAVALFIGHGRSAGYIAAVILWAAVILSFVI